MSKKSRAISVSIFAALVALGSCFIAGYYEGVEGVAGLVGGLATIGIVVVVLAGFAALMAAIHAAHSWIERGQ